MNKGLEVLPKLKDRADHDEYLFRQDTNREKSIKFLEENNSYFSIVEQELKVLEVIKKGISMNRAFKDQTKHKHDLVLIEIKALITDKEYDLLKEVLS